MQQGRSVQERLYALEKSNLSICEAAEYQSKLLGAMVVAHDHVIKAYLSIIKEVEAKNAKTNEAPK